MEKETIRDCVNNTGTLVLLKSVGFSSGTASPSDSCIVICGLTWSLNHPFCLVYIHFTQYSFVLGFWFGCWGIIRFPSYVYFFQLAFLREYRGLISIWMGLTDILAMIGRWSLEVWGPCYKWRLKVNFLFDIILSGVVRNLLPSKVWKFGPWWVIWPVLSKVSSCLPLLLVLLSPRYCEFAFISFISARIGLLKLSSLVKS